MHTAEGFPYLLVCGHVHGQDPPVFEQAETTREGVEWVQIVPKPPAKEANDNRAKVTQSIRTTSYTDLRVPQNITARERVAIHLHKYQASKQ